ncbi:histidine kinase N-terminal 7TM domain-containing diguanylate cyclase [Paenibacillus sp. Soil750]|uniref:histidine kinase N-terminal 7TM domain-containing diguanylate cyclase n=1 Tax=Paenibacillus sp. Soil750 TaxID=1736398 RepID=UPI0006F644DA|nr:histidine kinase N-terminal 7TM domain-containing protein [Paenibacillus sp. Soil750]KRE58216.1 diguanylate cyclase [Paenibacillus sp. Soil750]
MDPKLTMFISLIATSGVFTVFLCLYAYIKRKEIPGAYTFVIYTATEAIYIFAHAFEMASSTLAEVKRWTILEYIGIGAAPAIGLLIVMQYVGLNLTRSKIAALFVIPAITFFMVSTNEYHHLFYKDMYFRENVPFPTTDIVIGQYYIVPGAYIFGCMLAAVVLLLRRWRQTKKAYRLQLVTLIMGQFMPMTGAFIYLMGITPYGIDPVPMILCITSAMYIWAIVSTRMLTIIPIAKDRIFESMREGAIVLDFADRLVDFNGVINSMFPELTTDTLGLTLDEAWIRLSGKPFPVLRSQDGAQEEFSWRAADGKEFYYQTRSSVVRGRNGEPIGSLLMLIDVTEQKLLQDQLERLAYYDGLTKLLNRTEFLRRGKMILEEDLIGEKSTCILLFDIDHFKSINDTYGHDVGDLAIQHVVRVARQIEVDVPSGLIARYGGEEFVIALPACSLDEAALLAEKIRARLAAEPMSGSYGSIAVTASFGLTQASHRGESLEMLLKHADMALYQAKRAGRNQVQVYEGPVEATFGTSR